jgi:hypothetical protein
MNKVPHLLGNVYIEYKSHEEARQAFLSVKERSYAKKKVYENISVLLSTSSIS